MAAAYLHGVEVITTSTGIRPIQVVRTGVIGLVGIAPKGTSQSLINCSSSSDDAQFGLEIPGFSIPQALAAIRAQKPSTVLVVNVWDETTMTTAVSVETLVISATLGGKLAFPPVQAGQGSTVSLFQSNGTTPVTWVYGTDYTLDDYGNFQGLTTNVTAGTYKATYKKINSAAVTSSVIIGAETTTTRTGLFLFKEAYVTYGYKAKWLIAPGYSSLDAVRVALEAHVPQYRGQYIADAPAGTSVTNAIAGRGPSGSINFNTSSKRGVLIYPMLKAYDTYTNANQNRPASQFLAGLISKVHTDEGYHVSFSNHYFAGVTGVEKAVTWDPGDITGTTEANQLNAAGIVTTVNEKGFLSWGNRNASYPGNTGVDNFIPVQTVRDAVEDSIQYYMLPYVDKPVTLPQIDFVTQTVNTFINDLIGREALIQGSNVIFDPSLNSVTTLAAGQIIFTVTMMSPIPGERLTFYSTLDVNLLKALLPKAA